MIKSATEVNKGLQTVKNENAKLSKTYKSAKMKYKKIE